MWGFDDDLLGQRKGDDDNNDHEQRDADEHAKEPADAGRRAQVYRPSHRGDLLGHPGPAVLLAEVNGKPFRA